MGSNTDDEGIPEFLLRRDPPKPIKAQSEVPMRKVVEKVLAPDDAQGAVDDADTETPAKPARKFTGKVKAAKAAKGNGEAKAAPKAAGKPAGKVKAAKGAKAAPAKKAAGKARKAPVRDPAKLDQFGFRKGSIKSQAAQMYATKKGSTLGEIKEKLGSTQFNLLTQLEEKGWTIGKKFEDGAGNRKITRYRIEPRAE